VTDGQTDGRTDGIALAITAFAMQCIAARCKNSECKSSHMPETGNSERWKKLLRRNTELPSQHAVHIKM